MNEEPTTPASPEGFTSGETIASFLDEAFRTQDVGKIARALCEVVHTKGMSAIAEQTGLTRERLETSLSEDGCGDLSFPEVVAIVRALGVRLSYEKFGA